MSLQDSGPIGDRKNFKGVENLEEGAFEKLFRAFYNHPFKVTNLDELRFMTTLADYYRALPSLNVALYPPCAAQQQSSDKPDFRIA